MATIQEKVLGALAAREGQWLSAADAARILSIPVQEARQALKRLSAVSKIERRELPADAGHGNTRVEYRVPSRLEWDSWPGWAGPLIPAPLRADIPVTQHVMS